jgi:hypothetical protein
MTGTFDLKINDLGTPELHKKHRIALEPSDGAFVRAKVTNQLVIDDLLNHIITQLLNTFSIKP